MTPTFKKRLNNDGSFQSWMWYERIKGKLKKKSGFETLSSAKEGYETWSKKQGIKKHQSGKITMEKGAEMYMDNKSVDGATNTISRCNNAIKNHILPFFTDGKYSKTCITDLEREDANAWIKYLLEKGVSKKQINEILKVVKAISNFLYTDNKIAYDPFRNIKKLKVPKVEVVVYKVRQVQRMLRRTERTNKRFFMAMYLGFCTGLRVGELTGLPVENVDLRDLYNAKIHVRQQFTGGEFKNELKTISSERTVDLDYLCAVKLREYIKENNIKSGLIFKTTEGNPIDRNYIRKKWLKPLLKRIKFSKDLTIHDWRHTYASVMLMSGYSYLYVAKQLGHSDPSILLKNYAHFIPDAAQNERKTIGEIFSYQNVTILQNKRKKITSPDVGNVIFVNNWAILDSNQGPHPYQGCALAT